jgi:predicted amidohydrolase
VVASLRASVVQFPVTMDVAANLASLTDAVDGLRAGSFVVAPEGVLSGYLPEPGLASRLDGEATRQAIEATRKLTIERGLHLVVGACVSVDGAWRNSSFYMGPRGELLRYDKINLAQSERGDFRPGDVLPVFDLDLDGTPLRLGIQMCREIRYPEQWRVLAAQGAQVIAYVNNAVGSTNGHEVWRSHVISRAAETQRFVLGANNAAADQTCPSLIVAPSGQVLGQAEIGAETAVHATLNLDEGSDWVLSQARGDVVAVQLLAQG